MSGASFFFYLKNIVKLFIYRNLGIPDYLEVDDMIEMGDWPDDKCIFIYLTEIYNKLYAPKLKNENNFNAASCQNSENSQDTFSRPSSINYNVSKIDSQSFSNSFNFTTQTDRKTRKDEPTDNFTLETFMSPNDDKTKQESMLYDDRTVSSPDSFSNSMSHSLSSEEEISDLNIIPETIPVSNPYPKNIRTFVSQQVEQNLNPIEETPSECSDSVSEKSMQKPEINSNKEKFSNSSSITTLDHPYISKIITFEATNNYQSSDDSFDDQSDSHSEEKEDFINKIKEIKIEKETQNFDK